jgi:hypothetical protein
MCFFQVHSTAVYGTNRVGEHNISAAIRSVGANVKTHVHTGLTNDSGLSSQCSARSQRCTARKGRVNWAGINAESRHYGPGIPLSVYFLYSTCIS